MTPPPRSRRARWQLRLAVVAALYLLCWAVTWAFAPAALNRWWAAVYGPGSDAQTVEFHTGVRFAGEQFEYGPLPQPASERWCCVGRPRCPAPLVVWSEVASRHGSKANAGEVWFIWTPFRLIPVHQRWVWTT